MQRVVNINLRGIPRDLRDQFKGACSDRGENMTSVLTQFMKEYIDGRYKLDHSRTRRNFEIPLGYPQDQFPGTF